MVGRRWLVAALLALVVLPAARAYMVSGIPSCRRGPRSAPTRKCALWMAARQKQRRRQNVEGEFYVCEGCIDCGSCRWLAPETFSLLGTKSVVSRQPESEEDMTRAVQAMATCPTGSIRTETPLPLAKQVTQRGVMREIDPLRIPGVYQLGYHQFNSMGAAPFFITRTGGNVMVDVPRYSRLLAEALEALGGVDYLVLTNKNGAAQHDRWKAHFPDCVRVLHRHDMRDDTTDVEQILDGLGPWELEDAKDADLRILHTPGYTFGSLSIWHRSGSGHGVVFPGGNIKVNARSGTALAFSALTTGDLTPQVRSLRRLADPETCGDWVWLLPPRGPPKCYDSPELARKEINAAATSLEEDGRTLY